MSYTIQYRGGPNAGKKEVLPNLPNEMPVQAYAKPSTLLWMSDDGPTAIAATRIYGVYSRVFTPQKNGSYLYVWIKR